jgi:hypothetical protein
MVLGLSVDLCEVRLIGIKSPISVWKDDLWARGKETGERYKGFRDDLIRLHHSLVCPLSLLTSCHLQDILAL